ncbi:MAG: DUF4910 domain-containing protein [Candidatus Riflebacteria bacterium]|nr:DUF4910 domain-containing protein [Candidatus Riflebacteria bacterium]
MKVNLSDGSGMYELARRLFPINRSITGNGVRETLSILKEYLPELSIHEIPSGTKAFDWEIPREWNVKEAFIENDRGERIVCFKKCNLHLVGYSTPVDRVVTLDELKKHVYVQAEQPDVIPYVTSYYHDRFGFCMSKNQLDSLAPGNYRMFIDSELKPGSMTYGELIIPGQTTQEVFFSTYVCHPSMANNELSGPCVVAALGQWLASLPSRRYTYRLIFIPETIGSLAYLSKNLEALKKNVIAGFVVTCVGIDGDYSYIASRYGNTLADKVLTSILSFHDPEYITYSFLKRGSDERQYCAPGIDLPLCVFCRVKFAEYPEYHTSADNLDLISPDGLHGSLEVLRKCVIALENNRYFKMRCLGEPQLGKRGLYPNISQKGSYDGVAAMMNFIAYADGTNDLIDISNLVKVPVDKLLKNIELLSASNLLD